MSFLKAVITLSPRGGLQAMQINRSSLLFGELFFPVSSVHQIGRRVYDLRLAHQSTRTSHPNIQTSDRCLILVNHCGSAKDLGSPNCSLFWIIKLIRRHAKLHTCLRASAISFDIGYVYHEPCLKSAAHSAQVV